MRCFEDLGSLVEGRWRDHNYDEDSFPDVAAGALAEAKLNDHVTPRDILHWLGEASALPDQQDVDANFSDLPITVYDGSGFYIDVYYWLDGTTSLHHHSFCGAFQVLVGSSIVSQYSFSETERIDANLSAGQITLAAVELLERGAVRRILPGDQYIHCLFHLDRPSVSIVIRTRRTERGWPQKRYLKPYFAMSSFYRSPLTAKKVQSASLLLRMKSPDADELIREMISNSDFHTAFAILNLAYDHFSDEGLAKAFGIASEEGRFEALIEVARRRHGEVVDCILPVIDEARRQNFLVWRRTQIISTEHRYFLALLLNVPDRLKMLKLVKQRFPEQDPVDTVLDWVEELANTKVLGSSDPNVLAVDDFDDDYLFVFQCMLEGLTLDQTIAKFEKEFSPELAQGSTDKPAALYNSIRNSLIFRSIFADSISASRGPSESRKSSGKPKRKAGSRNSKSVGA